MDLVIESDIYEPTINEKGDYIDVIPCSYKFKNGIRCSCGTRKEHIYDNRQSFLIHCKTKTHQKWLNEINMNKMNYYVENVKLKELIDNQKIIIARLQKEQDENNQLITHLTKKIALKENTNLQIDLINF